MDRIVMKLVKKYKTNCPFQLAKHLNIHIRFEDLGEATKGMYYRKLRRRFIAIHYDLSDEWQRFVCAHELGHDRLHKGVSRFFIEDHSLFSPGKFERQANMFAVKLLTIQDKPELGESTDEVCCRNGIPKEMRQYY
jgi:Zn-dependent peptidase ImmA (M78 family)